jgi:hypothetical protein
MSHSKPKTQGLEWLLHSLNAFNGSGYADMDSPDTFVDSYISYKKMKKQPDAARLAEDYRPEALATVTKLLETTAGASRVPAQKYLDKFEKFKRGDLPQSTLL